MRHLAGVPASFFGMVLGLGGLGSTWRAAHDLWGLPAIVGETLFFLGGATWAVFVVLYVGKWWRTPGEALAELHHPVQCCFIGLVGVAAMVVAIGLLPHGRAAAAMLFWPGLAFTAGFAVWRSGLLWMGERDQSTITPVLYLPTVAGSFVASVGLEKFGQPVLAQLAFGMGLLSWLAIESVLLHRLYTGVRLPPALRTTLGIQLAPPVVGALAYLATHPGPPDLVVHAMLGYAVLQAALLLRLLPWILEQPFVPAYWAFTFGATALSTVMLQVVQQGGDPVLTLIAPGIFLGANLVVLVITLGTLRLLFEGRLLPRAVEATR
jgi:tellurite resistance protein